MERKEGIIIATKYKNGIALMTTLDLHKPKETVEERKNASLIYQVARNIIVITTGLREEILQAHSFIESFVNSEQTVSARKIFDHLFDEFFSKLELTGVRILITGVDGNDRFMGYLDNKKNALKHNFAIMNFVKYGTIGADLERKKNFTKWPFVKAKEDCEDNIKIQILLVTHPKKPGNLPDNFTKVDLEDLKWVQFVHITKDSTEISDPYQLEFTESDNEFINCVDSIVKNRESDSNSGGSYYLTKN